jgi:hypothetical protein
MSENSIVFMYLLYNKMVSFETNQVITSVVLKLLNLVLIFKVLRRLIPKSVEMNHLLEERLAWTSRTLISTVQLVIQITESIQIAADFFIAKACAIQ